MGDRKKLRNQWKVKRKVQLSGNRRAKAIRLTKAAEKKST